MISFEFNFSLTKSIGYANVHAKVPQSVTEVSRDFVMSLQQNKWGVYYYRTTIPADVSPTGKPKDFTFSLYTSSLAQARVAYPQVESAFLYLVTYCRRAKQVIRHKANPRRTGNLMYDLIASMMVGDTEVTIKSTAGNETAVASIINQVLSPARQHIPATTSVVATTTDVSGLPERKTIRVDVLYERYCKRAGVADKTLIRATRFTPYICELFGAKRICDITRDEAFTIKDKLPQLRSCKKGAKEIISASRANQTFSAISSFFSWAMKQGHIDYNPFDKLKLNINTEKVAIEPFTIDELKKLFEGEEFVNFTKFRGYRYWLCVLALYTGMRVTEIAQLEVADIKRNKAGRYFFELSEKSHAEGHSKRLKNTHSNRVVPLCKKIMELGFVDYLELIKKEKYDLLFPDMTLDPRTQETPTGHFSAKFSIYRQKILKNNKHQTFHSFRHNVVCLLKQKKIPLSDIQEFVGHAFGNITFDVYGTSQGAEELIEVADQIDFDINIPKWEDNHNRKSGRIEISRQNKEIRRKK